MSLARRRSWLAAISGAAGAGVLMGVGELIDGLSEPTPSLVIAFGDVVVERTPGDLVAVSIENLGTLQKPLLNVGIVLAALVVGGVAGWVAAAPPGSSQVTARRRQAFGIGLFALMGVAAAWSAAVNPMSSALAGWATGLAAAAVGLIAAHVALRAFGIDLGVGAAGAPGAQPDSTPPDEPAGDAPAASPPEAAVPAFSDAPLLATRRGFLAVASAGAAAVGLSAIGRLLRQNSSVVAARDAITLPSVRRATTTTGAASTTTAAGGSTRLGPAPAAPQNVASRLASLGSFDRVDGLSTYITPNTDFYKIDTTLSVPRVNPADWSLTINGMVDGEVSFTLDDILAMDLAEYPITLACVSNKVGGDLVGNAVWTGVPLVDLLDRAGVERGASQVVGRSVDGWTAGFPTDVVSDGRHAIVAVGMNGEPLPINHGFPARLVVAGLYGYVSAVKWVDEVTLTTWEGFDGYWVPRGWSKEGPIKTQSRIDLPSQRARVVAGEQTWIAGVAWAPTRGISGVEVRVGDEGWEQCEVADTLSADTWVQWRYPWTPTAGRVEISVRATDGTGTLQPIGPASPRPNGAEGYHTVAYQVVEA